MKWMLFCFHRGLILLLALFSLQTIEGDADPVSIYADLPNYEDPQLSPSGEQLAYFTALRGRRTLIVQSLKGDNPTVIPPWGDEVELHSYFWKSDEYIVLKIYMSLKRDSLRTRTDETRTISYHIPSGKVVWLGKPKRRGGGQMTSQIERVVDRLIDDPVHILLQADFEFDGYPSVFKVNLDTGARRREQNQKTGVNRWYTDQFGEVRLGEGYRVRSKTFNVFFKTAEGKWLNLEKQDWFENFDIMGFSDEPNKVYVWGLSRHQTTGVFLLDVLSGEVEEEVFSQPSNDVDWLIGHPVTGKMIGVSYVDDYRRQKYFNSEWDALQKKLSKPFPRQVVSIVSKARNQDRYLVRVSSDSNPGAFYIYSPSTNELAWFVNQREDISETSASTTRVDIPMRDESSIPAYVTWPSGDVKKSLPVVVLPHGGPGARDTQGWDYQTQYYASLGFLVLKPNFRGSTGYGPAFRRAGEYQWGGLMQDDVTDATRWLIDEGIADPTRICIVGSSYGGYAALMGAIKEPELYRCSIAINAVTNLPKLKSSDRHFLGGKAFSKKMSLTGSKDKEISPYHQLEKIEIPVLFMASKDDARIPVRDTIRMHKRMLRKDKQSTYVEIADGAHYLLTASSRMTMLKTTGEFLQLHLAGSTSGVDGKADE